MLNELLRIVPRDALNIALVFALAFFIGLEREEHKQRGTGYQFGGVRTFPLVGLISYALALLSSQQLIPWAFGFVVVGGFLLLSYHRKLTADAPSGMTTEMSALATYVVGGLVQREHYWIASTIAVLSVLLLELKSALEGLTRKVASSEIITVAKFLVLSVVILPMVPNTDFTRFHVNPFKTWVVVVAVSGVSFASYVLQRVLKGRGGVMLSAVLGGAYSSTVTTVVLARQSKREAKPNLFAGSILAASGVMYARLVLLLAFFDGALARALAPTFAALSLLAIGIGVLISRRGDERSVGAQAPTEPRNPLELRTAFLFASAFVAILVLTHLAREYLGRLGLYALAAVMGVTDVDPFILGIAQGGAVATPLKLAGAAVTIAAASNNVIKAIYAFSFADRVTGRRSVGALIGLAILGLVPLLWI
ncbi:MAG: MgtC/SapB family protein [Polyangiales bacterium]